MYSKTGMFYWHCVFHIWIEIVKKDLESIFKKNDIEAIECLNKKFDPNFHEAMLEVEDNTKEPGIVILVLTITLLPVSRIQKYPVHQLDQLYWQPYQDLMYP